MTNLVRFAIADLQEPGTHWLKVHDELLDKIAQHPGLSGLSEATSHPWNDRSEYVIFSGCTEDMIPFLQELSNGFRCSFEYPCTRDISAFNSMGHWYYPAFE